MKNENGFTLIELLAVIAILAIILLIATPIILNIIDDVRKGAFKSSAHGYVKAAEYKHLEGMLDGSSQEQIFTYVDGQLQGDEDLDYGGESPKNGTIHITKDGKIALAIHNGKWCAMKNYDNSEITMTDKTIENCKLDNLPDIVVVPGFDNKKGVNKPVLATGMKPIIYNEITGEWDEVNENNLNWYDYDSKKWANVRTADGSMWVWIPRYAYSIASCYHMNASECNAEIGKEAGEINIKFLKGKTNTVSDGTIIEEIPIYEGNSQTNYIKHPAFTFGNDELLGFWVAKFEMTGSISEIESKPNELSLRNVTAVNAFTYSRNMETNNRYGWGTTGVGIDTHMIKNTEWGAVAYLSHSTYGKNAEVTRNDHSGYLTGGGNYVNNVAQSTTGNIYGTYDMSGGAREYVAGRYGNISDKYYNYYSEYRSNMFGDAVYETSSGTTTDSSWYGDYSSMPTSSYPWLIRGGYYILSSTPGIFNFFSGNGTAVNTSSWRVVVMVGDEF